MTVSPEQVKTQKFTITKFRDGYDVEQVDEFLDQIAEDLEARDAEKAELEDQIASLQKELETARADQQQAAATASAAGASTQDTAESQSSESENDASTAAAATGSTPQGYADGDAQKSSAMLQLALELHDKYVHDGETKRDQLVQDGEQTAKRLVDEAQSERAEVLRVLGSEKGDLAKKIEQLREFEGEYRDTLRSYIQSQLRGLEGSPEPSGAPELN
jgi:DivIVA domain-containing protein